jgi:transposase InsO family protein
MGWQEVSVVQSRREFVKLASQDGANLAELCRRFEISRTTGYKWLERARSQAAPSLEDRSRRPLTSPARTRDAMEAAVVDLRRRHPAWGGRKIHHRLHRLGHPDVPAPSTITGILARHGLIDPEASAARVPPIRFEHEAPNRLWQMDFKGHVALAETAARCHPLTVVDDHSRFALELGACANERGDTVRSRLSGAFRRYGLPECVLTDNGAPWGSSGEVAHRLTPLNVWLIRLGIAISHSRPYHPQTHGKNERFNGTLKMELLRDHAWRDLSQAQAGFDRWRAIYNHERPHEGIGFAVPADRYRASARSFRETLLAIEYPAGTIVRSVHQHGFVKVRGRTWRVPKALVGHPVGIDPTAVDGVFEVRFLHHLVVKIDVRDPEE